uniref:Laminin G domain-containing protein n=1 Tax=Monopterus albus TaxID=43700 RepID=A0A3Q3IR45_MONAL
MGQPAGTKCAKMEVAAENLKHIQVSFSFRTSSTDSLIMWMGKAEHEDDDYLAVGLEGGCIKIAVNLGERLSLPVTVRNLILPCSEWNNVSIHLNSTIIQVFLNTKQILFEDVDPFERYVALDYGAQWGFDTLSRHESLFCEWDLGPCAISLTNTRSQ